MAQSLALASGGTGSPASSSWTAGRKSAISGSSTGSASSGSAIGSPCSSYTMGNGSPQYRCRENSQSRSR